MKYEFQIPHDMNRTLTHAVWADPMATRGGSFDGYSLLDYHADSMIRSVSSIYRPHEAAVNAGLKLKTLRIARKVFQSVWRDNVGNAPELPLAEIIRYSSGDSTLTARYLTEDDAREWEVGTVDYAVIRERLRPSVIPGPPKMTDNG